ncbi:MAG: disulfide reductase [Desulfobacteraceae bacterium 4572_88]|nr:MAG: disulfide reductase [Desulfobacteraceae bacterium 4572_88]
MKYSLFLGCKIPYYLKEYELSARAVLSALGVSVTDISFNCCGYPIRDESFEASVLSGARNIAIALMNGTHILTPCKCCFGNLKHVEHWLREDKLLRKKINELLGREGLEWEAGTGIEHILSVIYHDVGLESVRKRILRPHKGLRVAAHYGCHGLRPGNIVEFDNPLAPTIFESLIEVTGAEAVEWPRRLECCGSPLLEKNRSLSLRLMNAKLEDAEQSGAMFVCTACTYCQIQFDSVRCQPRKDDPGCNELPSVLYTKLLGSALGIPECNHLI